MAVSTLGMPGQLANESIDEYRQRFVDQFALIEAEAGRGVGDLPASRRMLVEHSFDLAHLNCRSGMKKIDLGVEDIPVFTVTFIQIDSKLDYLQAGPTRIIFCYPLITVPAPLKDAGVEVVDLHDYVAKIDREFKTQRGDDVGEGEKRGREKEKRTVRAESVKGRTLLGRKKQAGKGDKSSGSGKKRGKLYGRSGDDVGEGEKRGREKEKENCVSKVGEGEDAVGTKEAGGKFKSLKTFEVLVTSGDESSGSGKKRGKLYGRRWIRS
ncbi:hypothetical protein CBR_g13015 [Chara braunii]|uniref:Uncharacterized protein n=1 Tax=Chara braunii TaxID=69332 RepID=A0A388KTB8_CHABU|nr:hypothetical protein CBR_g13015 [Chara braunii]|eukprot:GBG73296.1 hypothetical protein CBR_g13015 [Chara braunii]